MNPTTVAVRSGIRRGGIELRQSLLSATGPVEYLLLPAVFLAVMFFLQDVSVPGTDVSLGTISIPSVVGMQVAFTGLAAIAMLLVIEREDGTLLRAKATPNGMLGYLVGKIVMFSGQTLVAVAILLVPGAFLFGGLELTSPEAWLTLAWVLALGLVATMPVGAVIGSLCPGLNWIGVILLPMIGLAAISGIFYPITALPGWLQVVAQIFPVYWLGLGMRSALLPESLASVEIGESWRHLETVGVLGAWAVVGLVLAPVILRRMARRESGSSVAERKQKALARGY